jgi:HK97 family phage portal protein
VKIFGLEISRAQKQAPFESVLMRLVGAQEGLGAYGPGLMEFFAQYVTPESCMRSPTVNAIVTAVSRRISVSPVQVFRRVQMQVDTTPGEGPLSGMRERRVRLTNHPVEKLLSWPNDWQTTNECFLDATSRLLRYGNYFAYTSRGSTGPIRELIPLHPRQVTVQQDIDTWKVTYRFNAQEIPNAKMHHVRGPARNCFRGDSPIIDVNVSIGLEIAAEGFGATFFNNGALPLMIFRYAQGMQPFKNAEDEKAFVNAFQTAVGGPRRHRAMLLPKGIETGDPVKVENDKAQFLETRKYQRTVIAGAFGVPPHLVGDLERATFNNVEQQDADFTINVVMPITQQFEAAMERDLLTDADRAGGVIVRFNLNAVQRADFKSRQEGLLVQRNAGVICPNDWREAEGMNPIPEEDGGENYIYPLNYVVAGKEPPVPAAAPAATEPATAPPKPDGAAKALIGHLLSEWRAVRELVEARESRAHPIEVIVNMPEQAPPVVNNEVKVAPAQVHIQPAPITVEGTTVNVQAPQVNVEAAAPSAPVDKVIERGADGRLKAIRALPSRR